jgi:hypothetical protein
VLQINQGVNMARVNKVMTQLDFELIVEQAKQSIGGLLLGMWHQDKALIDASQRNIQAYIAQVDAAGQNRTKRPRRGG